MPRKPQYVRDAETIEKAREQLALARVDFSPEEISRILGVGLENLRRYYAFELDYGPQLARQKLLTNLQHHARKGNPTALRLLAETLGDKAGVALEKPPLPPRRRAMGRKEAVQKKAERPPKNSPWADLLN